MNNVLPPPSREISSHILPTYGFEKHIREYGNGTNLLRTPRVAQPRALRKGDILATGDRVLEAPREGFNGVVFVCVSGGREGHWISLPGRIPVALLTEEDGAPEELWERARGWTRKSQ